MADIHYQDGYNTGMRWKDNYRPGGLYVGTKPLPHYKDALVKWEQRKKDAEDWLRGFDNAIADRGITLGK